MTLHPELIGQVQNLLEDELLRRGAAAPELGLLELDPQVVGVRVAASARAASGGLEGLAPGSMLPLTPQGTEATTTARLFMHWAQKDRAGSIGPGPVGRLVQRCRRADRPVHLQ
ncbi:hypothetical protein [Deinococcus marmoris]|uniref:hypothetical protein n=1 Tax=Deinococcus marmoris TaxID=249408 RepID=UPI0004980C03|nr:hypothetical protein [Deinococcus marmoris]